jgi:hypothetical protein
MEGVKRSYRDRSTKDSKSSFSVLFSYCNNMSFILNTRYCFTVVDMANEVMTAIIFVVGLIISTVIIYVVARLFKQKEGIGRAFLTALIGTIVYTVVYFIFGQGWVAGIIGGIVWLIALRALYDIGWLRALGIAVIVWIAAIVVGLLLPTVPGPL